MKINMYWVLLAVSSIIWIAFINSIVNEVTDANIKIEKIKAGLQECVIIIPSDKHSSRIIWKKECPSIIYKGVKNGN